MSTWSSSRGLRKALLAVLVLSLLQAVPVGAQEEPAPVVTAAEGSAWNYQTDVSLFGGPRMVRGYNQVVCTAPNTPVGCVPANRAELAASPAVECPEGGGPASETKETGARAEYGPAQIFAGIWPEDRDEQGDYTNTSAPPSGPLTSEVDCRLGENGYVTASTSVILAPGATRAEDGTWMVPPTPTWTTPPTETTPGRIEPWPGGLGPGPLIADEAHSTCTMAADGTVTSNVSFVNGIVETRYDPATQLAVESEPIPDNPPEGYEVSGTIDHVGDSFRITFNKQTENADGSFTVVAAHMELLGPTAVGDMYVGSVTCGPVTAEGGTTTTTTLPDGTTTTTTLPDGTTTTTTLPDGVTTTTLPDGVTTTTTLPDGVTTTTLPDGVTTTTLPDGQPPPPPPSPPTDATCVDLRLDDGLAVGEVCVTRTVDNLLVNYSTTANWRLRATRLHVAHSPADIPRNQAGNADPRRFGHWQPLNRPPVMSFTHVIPLADLGATAGDQLIVAPQADVQGRDRRGMVSAWGEGTPTGTGGVQASSHLTGDHPGSFFAYTVQDTTGMTCVDLSAGGRQAVGEVCARNVAGNLLVAYHATGEWELRATRVHVADDVGAVPRDRFGHPAARDFDHWAPHRPPAFTFTHTASLAGLGATAGDVLVAAAQADVQHPTRRDRMRRASAWGDGQPFDTGHDHPAGFSHGYRYFTHVVQ